jgi:Ser/Thr protein kinase RdoA (MazF antagonist)
VERARAAGYRTPRRVSSGVSEDGFAYQVQEFVRGTRATRLTADTARRLVPLLESQRGLDIDPGHCWSRYADERAGPAGAGVRHAVAGSGARGRAFVAALDALVAASGEDRLPSGDLVHGDFRLGNIVFPPADGPVALDVDAMGSGTRAYDYATLLTEDEVEPGGWQVVRAAGERVAGAAALARCFASAALDLADFVRLRVPERLPAVIGPLTERAVALAPR